MRFQRYSDRSIRDDYPHAFGAIDFRSLAVFLGGAKAVVPVCEAGDPRNVVMRHDVDHNLDHALRFAEWEAAQGFRATYYVLPTAWDWQEASTVSNLRRLEALGHEVGVHQDTVAEAAVRGFKATVDGSALPAGNCDKAAEILREQIAELTSLGLTVRGTSAHGTPLWKTDGITNVFLWAAGYTAADFGLEYADAYHLHRKALYVSDNRGGLSSPMRREPGRETHLLLHPAHWAAEELAVAA